MPNNNTTPSWDETIEVKSSVPSFEDTTPIEEVKKKEESVSPSLDGSSPSNGIYSTPDREYLNDGSVSTLDKPAKTPLEKASEKEKSELLAGVSSLDEKKKLSTAIDKTNEFFSNMGGVTPYQKMQSFNERLSELNKKYDPTSFANMTKEDLDKVEQSYKNDAKTIASELGLDVNPDGSITPPKGETEQFKAKLAEYISTEDRKAQEEKGFFSNLASSLASGYEQASGAALDLLGTVSGLNYFDSYRDLATGSRFNADLFKQQANKYDKTVEEYAKNGEVGKAFGTAVTSAVESLPYMIPALVNPEYGVYVMGGMSGIDKYRQLEDEKIPEWEKVYNAVSSGIFEAIFEKVGTGAILSRSKRALLEMGEKQGREAIVNAVTKTVENSASKMGAMPEWVKEGLSEVATGIGQDITDKVTYKPDTKIGQSAVDNFVVGALMGKIFALPQDLAKGLGKLESREFAKKVLDKLPIDMDVETKVKLGWKIVERDRLQEAENKLDEKFKGKYATQLTTLNTEIDNIANDYLSKAKVEEVPELSVGKVDEVGNEQAQIDYLKERGVTIPDGTTMEQLSTLYEEEKSKERQQTASAAKTVIEPTAESVSETKPKPEVETKVEPTPVAETSVKSPYVEDVNNVSLLADKIIKGETLTPEDLQLQKNYPVELEKELKTKQPEVVSETILPKESLKDVESTTKALSGKTSEDAHALTNWSIEKSKRLKELQDIEDNSELSESEQREMDILSSEFDLVDVYLLPEEHKAELGWIYDVPHSSNIAKAISISYHKAKSDGSNPDLVNAVESLLTQPEVSGVNIGVEQLKTKENGKESSEKASPKENGWQEVLTEDEVSKTSKAVDISPKNLRDVYKAGREIFGLNKVQSLAQAIVTDRVVSSIARKLGKTKRQIYSELEYRKEDALLRSRTNAYFQAAWHGSPYQFDKFSMEHMGKGEGAQAFGWGMYFTDIKGVAEDYAKKLSNREYNGTLTISDTEKAEFYDKNISQKRFEEIRDANIKRIENLLGSIPKLQQLGVIDKNDPNPVLGEYGKQLYELDLKALKEAKTVSDIVASRNLYKVELHKGKTAEEYDWLVWDKKLTNEQIDKLSPIYAENEKTITNEANKIDPSKVVSIKSKTDYDRNRYFEVKHENGKITNITDAEIKNINDFTSRDEFEQNGNRVYELLSDILGSDKEASMFLLKVGIDGIKYPAESIARGATSDNARGSNYVVFDENAITIEEVIKFQDKLQGKRGAYMMNNGVAIVYALTDPNVSTPLHELAHVYERYMLPSERSAVLSWTGDKTWTVSTSENFARGFERYLAEGVAPTKKLQAIFDRFKKWLTDIYEGIKGSEIDVKLNADMKRVYDSVLTGKPYVPSVEKVSKTDNKQAKTTTYDDVDSLLFQEGENTLPPTINIDGVERPTTNSNGNQIHPTEEGVRNFYKWFGDSKVVDKQGRPLVVYHGGRKGIDEFYDPSSEKFVRNRGINSGTGEFGIYFTADKGLARVYTKGHKRSDRQIYEAYVKMDRPYITNAFLALRIRQFFNKNLLNPQTLTKDNIKEIGDSDGIIWQGLKGEIIPLKSTQIKSATGNLGTFDPNNPSILFQEPSKELTEKHRQAVNNLINHAEQEGAKDVGSFVRVYLAGKGNPIKESIINEVLKQRGYANRDESTQVYDRSNETGKEQGGSDSNLSVKHPPIVQNGKEITQEEKVTPREEEGKKVSLAGKRFFNPNSKVSVEAQQLINDKGVHLYKPTSILETEQIAIEFANNSSIEELASVSEKEFTNGALHLATAVASMKRLDAEITKAKSAGLPYDRFLEIQSDLADSFTKRLSGAGLTMKASQSDMITEYLAPETHSRRYVKEAAYDRRKQKATEYFKGKKNVFTEKAKKIFDKTTEDMLSTPQAKKATQRAQNSLNSVAEVPTPKHEKTEAQKKRESIIDKWKKSVEARSQVKFQSVGNKNVASDEDMKFAKELADSYLEEGQINRNTIRKNIEKQFESLSIPVTKEQIASIIPTSFTEFDLQNGSKWIQTYLENKVYNRTALFNKVRKRFNTLGVEISDEVILTLIPDKFNKMSIDDLFELQQLDAAAERLAGRIFGVVLEGEKKTDPLSMMVNTLFSKFKERNATEAKEKKSDLEKIVEAIRNKADYADTWKEAKNIALEAIDKDPMTDLATKEEAKAKVLSAYKEATNFTFTENQVRSVVRKVISDRKIKIDDVVRSHASVMAATRQSIEQTLMDMSGLEEDEAIIFRESIKNIWDRMLTDRASNLISKETKKLEKKAKNATEEVDKRIVKTDAEKLLELILLRAFEDEAFVEAYATVHGIPKISQEHVTNIENMAKEIRVTPSPSVKRMRKDDLLMYMKRITGISWQEKADAMWYGFVLSGVSTQTRNTLGANMNVNGALMVDGMTNPARIPEILKGYKRGASFGKKKAGVILRTGHAFFESKMEAPNIAEHAANKNWSNLFKNLAYVTRFMVASDQFNVSIAKESFAQQLANEQLNVNLWKKFYDKEYRDKVNQAVSELLSITPEQIAEIDKLVAEEAALYDYDRNEQIVRKQELIDEKRNEKSSNLVIEAEKRATDATGNTQAYGTVGYFLSGMANTMQRSSRTLKWKGKEYEVHPFKYIASFTKISGNLVENSLSYTPIGFFHVLANGRGLIAPKESSFRREFSPSERRKAMERAIWGSLTMGLLFSLMNPDDEDHWLKITGSGTGNFATDSEIKETKKWRPYSIYIGDARFSYKYSPFGFMLAPLGYMNDMKRFVPKYKDTNPFVLLAQSVFLYPSLIAQSTPAQNMITFVDNLVAGLRNENAVDAIAKTVGNTLKVFDSPGLLKDAFKTIEFYTNRELMENNTFYNGFIDKTVFDLIPVFPQDNFPAVDAWGQPQQKISTLDEFFGVIKSDNLTPITSYHYDQGAGAIGSPKREQMLFEVKYADGSISNVTFSRNVMEHRRMWNSVFMKTRGDLLVAKIIELKSQGLTGKEYVKEFNDYKAEATIEARKAVYDYTLSHPLPVSDKPDSEK